MHSPESGSITRIGGFFGPLAWWTTYPRVRADRGICLTCVVGHLYFFIGLPEKAFCTSLAVGMPRCVRLQATTPGGFPATTDSAIQTTSFAYIGCGFRYQKAHS